MKALTIQQPWASLITMGVKIIETRSWSSKYRGPLAIHAGLKKANIFEDEWIWEPLLDSDRVGRLRTALHLGAVVGTCVVESFQMRWYASMDFLSHHYLENNREQ